ncbi:MAG TPA: Clp protease N-terminal domain-containing protein [Candidatus Angelobacter sp.]|nr:Clp protease N-terminal domain-containing protein [Candidatus Angelobacter sp.]
MFERYTGSARLTIFRARYVASQVGSLEIETEHLLLGVLNDKTLASRFLGSPWAAETVWKMVEPRKPIRDKAPGEREIPLDKASKRALNLPAEEADLLSSRRIGTEHLLLGLLREEKNLAAEILFELGVLLESIRAELSRMPHDDSKQEEFVRERGPLPEDVVALETRVKSIRARLTDAIFNHDFEKSQAVSVEESAERDKLVSLYRKHGLSDWIWAPD